MNAPLRTSHSYNLLRAGDPAPWFSQRTLAKPKYNFDGAAGRYQVLCFIGSAGSDIGMNALRAVGRNRSLFDDTNFAFFGVTVDSADAQLHRIIDQYPGIRFYLDFDGRVSRMWGAAPLDETICINVPIRNIWVVVDPTLRILSIIPFDEAGEAHESVFAFLRSLPPPALYAGFPVQAPILVLPNVFDRTFCQQLIDLYEFHGGEETGFMEEVNGKTVGKFDRTHKRRRDHMIEEEPTMKECQKWVQRRIIPEIEKVHHFIVTRMERYLIGCYTAEDGGHFAPHRDNTTSGTAHRKFAVSINLNDDFDGGQVGFPEYGPQTFKAPAGGAVVFSCSLLHTVTPVRRGRRYAFLPFLYDDAAANVREMNNEKLSDDVEPYDPNKTSLLQRCP